MSIIKNIGFLDTRDISEELAGRITEISNIGVFVYNDRSQNLLLDAKRVNIGTAIKLKDDEDIDVSMRNGELKIDNDYLKYLRGNLIINVNGVLFIDKDVEADSIYEKLYGINVNGKLIAPNNLSGILDSRATVNGKSVCYNRDYIFINKLELNNDFLNNLENNSNLSTEDAVILENIDIELLNKKVSNIEVLGKLIIMENQVDSFKAIIKDYFSVNKKVIPNYKEEIRLLDKDMIIDDSSILNFHGEYLYSLKNIEIYLDETHDIERYIEFIGAKEIITNRETYEKIKDIIIKDTKITVIDGKQLKNLSSLVLTGVVSEKLNIKNLGELYIRKDIDIESFEENIVSIENLGLVKVDKEVIDIVRNKLTKNLGELEIAGEENEESEEDILYINISELTL